MKFYGTIFVNLFADQIRRKIDLINGLAFSAATRARHGWELNSLFACRALMQITGELNVVT